VVLKVAGCDVVVVAVDELAVSVDCHGVDCQLVNHNHNRDQRQPQANVNHEDSNEGPQQQRGRKGGQRRARKDARDVYAYTSRASGAFFSFLFRVFYC